VQILRQEFFFVEQPPNEAEDGEHGGNETPVGAERQDIPIKYNAALEYIGLRTIA
jgi:hypothetical protein